MSDVIIRCPNCGTTQRALGECEACHEAEARWFCPNHAPGRWLEAPSCAACGARFTGRAQVDPTPIPPARPARPAEPSRHRTPARVPGLPMPPTRREPEEPEEIWVDAAEPVRWPGGLRMPVESPMPAVRVGIGQLFGCVGRLAMVLIVMFVAAVLGFFGYCGGVY